MSASAQLGPLAISWFLLLGLVALITGNLVADRMARKQGVPQELPVIRIAVAGILAARLAFVARYATVYLEDPASMLDIRDGGWNLTAGLVAAWLYGVWLGIRNRPLLRPLAAGLLITTVLWVSGSVVLENRVRTLQTPLPVLTLTDLKGEAVELQTFKGKPVVLNLWASWCPPCVREMPVLQSAQTEYPDVHFVFVNQGESGVQIKEFLQRHQLELANMLKDPDGQTAQVFNQKGLPSTLFFNAEGKLTAARLGEVSRATLLQQLERF